METKSFHLPLLIRDSIKLFEMFKGMCLCMLLLILDPVISSLANPLHAKPRISLVLEVPFLDLSCLFSARFECPSENLFRILRWACRYLSSCFEFMISECIIVYVLFLLFFCRSVS